jgi:hypothetical protein
VADGVVGVSDHHIAQLRAVQSLQLLAAYLLIHQVTQTKDLPAVLARMDWSWAILALVASTLTYVGAALNLIGGFVQRLSLGLTTAVQLGGSFINRISR